MRELCMLSHGNLPVRGTAGFVNQKRTQAPGLAQLFRRGKLLRTIPN